MRRRLESTSSPRSCSRQRSTEAEEIIAAADEAGIALVVSLPQLYHGYTRAIVEQLEEERLGELTYCRIRLSHDGAIAGWLPERFYDPAAAVGGALSDLGCHPVYLTQLFLGALPATVSATYASFTKRQVEDQAVVTLGYPDGAIGVVETGFLSRDPFTIEIHGTSGEPGVRKHGEPAPDAERRSGHLGVARRCLQDEADAFSRWVTHIRDGTRADDNLTRAVELTRLVSTANTAAATGTTVRYPIGASVSTIKVGLIGGGGIVDAHIRGYRAYADAIEVTAVADVVTETVRRRAAELGAAAYTDFRQMISEADLDAVDICLPHHLHADAIVAAAQAGKAHLVREAALPHGRSRQTRCSGRSAQRV